jgi:hypothetical protein
MKIWAGSGINKYDLFLGVDRVHSLYLVQSGILASFLESQSS